MVASEAPEPLHEGQRFLPAFLSGFGQGAGVEPSCLLRRL